MKKLEMIVTIQNFEENFEEIWRITTKDYGISMAGKTFTDALLHFRDAIKENGAAGLNQYEIKRI